MGHWSPGIGPQLPGLLATDALHHHHRVRAHPFPSTGVPLSKETAPPLGPPKPPRHSPTVGSWEGAVGDRRPLTLALHPPHRVRAHPSSSDSLRLSLSPSVSLCLLLSPSAPLFRSLSPSVSLHRVTDVKQHAHFTRLVVCVPIHLPLVESVIENNQLTMLWGS